MLSGFQQYLVDKGFKRTCTEHCGTKEIGDYKSTSLSSYNPLHYEFRKDYKYAYWGLSEHKKSPVMYLGRDKILVLDKKNYIDKCRTTEDGYRILFSKWGEDRYDEIYDVFMSKDKYFKVDCTDESNITIEVKKRNN